MSTAVRQYYFVSSSSRTHEYSCSPVCVLFLVQAELMSTAVRQYVFCFWFKHNSWVQLFASMCFVSSSSRTHEYSCSPVCVLFLVQAELMSTAVRQYVFCFWFKQNSWVQLFASMCSVSSSSRTHEYSCSPVCVLFLVQAELMSTAVRQYVFCF